MCEGRRWYRNNNERDVVASLDARHNNSWWKVVIFNLYVVHIVLLLPAPNALIRQRINIKYLHTKVKEHTRRSITSVIAKISTALASPASQLPPVFLSRPPPQLGETFVDQFPLPLFRPFHYTTLTDIGLLHHHLLA